MGAALLWLALSIHPGWWDRDLQRGIGRFPILPLPGQLVVAPPSSSKAQAGSRNGQRTFLPSSWAAPLGIIHSYKLPSGGQDSQRVSSGLRSCKTALTKLPAGTAPGATIYTSLFDGSPARALQTPHGQFSFTHWGQAWHVTPPQPLRLLQPCSHQPCVVLPPRGPARVALGFSQNSPTRSRRKGSERHPPWGTRQGELPAPRRGNEPGNYRKRAIQREASLAPARRRARRVLGPPFPGAGRPWVGNPARCGKRSRDGGCQATLIQPLTNFQHFPASAAEPNQQTIKHQVHLEPVVSICPSKGLAHGLLPGVPCEAMGPPLSPAPKASPG